MRRKKWIILGVCMLFCMINIAGCVKKESKKITTGSSVDKIVKEYNLTEEDAHNKAVKILERCPEKLRQNVQEWSENRTLTDIYIGKYSLPMILAIWDSKDFLSAWEVMTELAEGEIETAEMRIWNMRR